MFFFFVIPNMSVLLHVNASNQIRWHIVYCLVGSCLLQSVLSLKVPNCLDQGTVTQAIDPKWLMEAVRCGYYFFCTREVSSSKGGQHFSPVLWEIFAYMWRFPSEERFGKPTEGTSGWKGWRALNGDRRLECCALQPGPAGAQAHPVLPVPAASSAPFLELQEQTA